MAVNFTQVGKETWVANNPALRVTQTGFEVWRSVSVAAVVTYVSPGRKNVKWRRAKQHAAFAAAAKRRRLEAAPPIPVSVTPMRVTQAGSEVWVTALPSVRFTQNGMEVWRAVANAPFVPTASESRKTEHARFFVRKPLVQRHDLRRMAAPSEIVSIPSGRSRKDILFRDFFVKKPLKRGLDKRRHNMVIVAEDNLTYVGVVT